MLKACENCGNQFPRNPAYTDKQWSVSRFCCRRCAALKTVGGTEMERFFSFVEVDPITHCWNWTGAKDAGGYGFSVGVRSHRVIYERATGSIPAGMLVLHRCDNRACVNPLHLFLGTHQDNCEDMNLKGRGNPPRGEMCHGARLTEADVIAIRDDPRFQSEIASAYGIAQTTVSAIKRKVNWKHVP